MNIVGDSYEGGYHILLLSSFLAFHVNFDFFDLLNLIMNTAVFSVSFLDVTWQPSFKFLTSFHENPNAVLLDCTCLLPGPAESSRTSHRQASNDWFWWCS